jgi:hypothetical protein
MNAWSGVEVFGNISSLRSIRLDFNYINVVKESFFPESLIANLTMVNMAFNPFYCRCQNLWFRKWIDERPTLFSNYPKDYTCINPPELEGTKLKDYFPSDSECNPTDTFVNVVFKTFSSIIIIRDPFSSFKNFLCAIRISKRHQSLCIMGADMTRIIFLL